MKLLLLLLLVIAIDHSILYRIREALMHVFHVGSLIVSPRKGFQVGDVLQHISIVVVDDNVVDGGLRLRLGLVPHLD